MAETARLSCVGEGVSALETEFVEFFRAEYPRLVRALYLLTTDLSEAEELAQEAMARTYERWDRVAGMESPGGYVYQAAVNLNRKRLRRLAVRARRLVALSHQPNSARGVEARTELASAIASLSDGQRDAFLLVEWFGLSAEEAGRILGIRPASVRSRIHRARTTLRERLSESEEERG
jgi:RNA polymerase sigma-70 factor, ECF subfamily